MVSIIEPRWIGFICAGKGFAITGKGINDDS